MLLNLLQRHWGYSSFRPLQEEAIKAILERRDSLVVLPTGGGKSLCYQLPALALPGLALVVSPLISLMKDQVDALREIGIEAAALNSAATLEEQRATLREANRGALKLLYLSPERLLSPGTRRWLEEQPVSMIAIDEAHCISSWGHDFRPEYRALSQLRELFPDVSLHAFTATATPQVRSDIAAQLQLRGPAMLVGDFHRPNLIYHVERRTSGLDHITRVMDRFRGQSGVIYAITRDKVEQLSKTLNDRGYKTRPYHAGLSEKTRARNQDALLNDKIEAIVATVAFGMGIDKSDVRYVIHAEMPKSLEGYQQESGRAGRDGLEAECWLFYSGGDLQTWRFILDNAGEPAREHGLRSLQQMSEYCAAASCRHKRLVEHFGQEFTAKCQSCDVCLGKVELAPDALILGQKILSCVLRCRERFGGEHIAKVLLGSDDARVLQYGHQNLSTWGLLREHSKRQIRTWIDQLLAQGYLETTGEYRVLAVTQRGRRLLKGEETPPLTVATDEPSPRSTRKKKDDFEGVDRGLFDELRRLRRTLAEQAGVPPFIVFGDATLCDLARRRPLTRDELLQVHGIGQRKCDAYGEALVQLIARYCSQNRIDVPPSPGVASPPAPTGKRAAAKPSAPPAPPRVPKEAAALFDQGLCISDVSLRLGRAPSTVYDYLIEYLKENRIEDASRWAAPEEIEAIEQAASSAAEARVEQVHELLGGSFSNGVIRVVLACRDNRLAARNADKIGIMGCPDASP